MKGYLYLFKDRNLQQLFDGLMLKKTLLNGGTLDLGSVRDIFTHSYHQERFIELMLRTIEDNGDEITRLNLRI